MTPAGAVSLVLHTDTFLSRAVFAAAPDGSIWFSTGSGAFTRVAMDGTTTSHPLQPEIGLVQAVAFGPDGTPWFTTPWGVGHIAGGSVVFYPIASGLPTQALRWDRPALAVTPNGRLWIAQSVVSNLPPPPPNSDPSAPAVIGSAEVIGIDPTDLPALVTAQPIPATGTIAGFLIVIALAGVALCRMR